jgi:hypothetical protein
MNRILTSAGIALLLATVAPAVVLAGNGESLVARLPSGMEGVVSIDVEQLRSAGVYADLTSILTSAPDYRGTVGTLTENGVTFDPTTDVLTVVIAVPDMDDDPDPNDGVMLVEARFDVDQVLAAAAANDYEVLTIGDVRYFVARNKTIAILDATTVAVGSTTPMMRMINAANGEGTAGPGPSLRAQVRAADKSRTVWFAAVRPNGTAGILSMNGGATIGSALNLAVTGAAASAEEATRLVDEATEQRTRLATDPAIAAFGLAPVLEAASLTADEANLNLSLALNAATWSSLSAQLLAIMESEI